MARRLGAVARQARTDQGVSLMRIAVTAGVSQSTVALFETSGRWRYETDAIVAAYEEELGLPPDELWRRALEPG